MLPAEDEPNATLSEFNPSRVVSHERPVSVEGAFAQCKLVVPGGHAHAHGHGHGAVSSSAAAGSSGGDVVEHGPPKGSLLCLVECGDAGFVNGSQDVRFLDPVTGRLKHRLSAEKARELTGGSEASSNREVLAACHLDLPIKSAASSNTSSKVSST